MRLPGRIAAAIEVLSEVESRHRPVSEALKAWGLAHRFAGAGDRAAIGNLVYDALRRRASHAWAMGTDSARALVLSVVVREWGETPERLNADFYADSHAPAPLGNDEVARLSAPAPLEGAPDHVRADLPDWIAGVVSPVLGADWVAEGQALADRPPLDLRVNTLKADRERTLKALARFRPEPSALADAIRIPAGTRDSRTPHVTADESYLKGWIEVQDLGSQMVALVAAGEAGEQVLDFCAGAGGKTLALAAAMRNRGQIFAHDSDRRRLAPIYDRLKRAGVRNVQVRPPGDGALNDLVGGMDRVVVDAPCTGAGTWRRRPETKWKLSPHQLSSRVAEQRVILATAARFVKPGGTLCYITCSILPDENGAQVEDFLAGHSDFAAVPGAGLWHGRIGSAARARFLPEGGVLLTPATTGCDGFYFAALRRR